MKNIEYAIEEYVLRHRLNKAQKSSFKLVADKEDKALNTKCRIIYIVKNQNNFIYVGEAKSSLEKRIERGFSAFRHYRKTGVAKKGYKGYKWIELLEQNELKVFAIIFEKSLDSGRTIIEAIEAEIVYLIRNNTNAWPDFQNEIHFNNIEAETVQKTAQAIFNEISLEKRSRGVARNDII